jgi:hypothetical protein
MRIRQFRQPVPGLVLLVALAPFALDGCVSVGVEHASAPPSASESASASVSPETGAFEARLYETGSDARTGQASSRRVTWALFSRSNPSGHPFREGTGSVWSVADLEPGTYKIVVSWGPKPREAGPVQTGRNEGRFTLTAGDSATARVIVKTQKTWLYIALGIGILLAGAIVIDDLSHGRMPDVSW